MKFEDIVDLKTANEYYLPEIESFIQLAHRYPSSIKKSVIKTIKALHKQYKKIYKILLEKQRPVNDEEFFVEWDSILKRIVTGE